MSSQLRITRRNLPHWQLGGATYFVTFGVKKGTLTEQERSLVLAACRHWHLRKWKLHAVVVMPSHVHLLAQPLPCGKNEWYPLGEILHSIKSYSAHQVNKRRQSADAVWLDESFDRIVRDQAEFREKLLYIARNPLKAGLARTERDYPYFWLGGDTGETPVPPGLKVGGRNR
ncbi:transposase [Acidobacteriia bacterium AH_259_A11_L15]|nr:transposase [Acidobacteriia bacterium AH_259_A11_L15]